MAVTKIVDVYSAGEDTFFKVSEEELRKVATTELGMVAGPFELNLFTKTILATALQREQIERNTELAAAMTGGGDWKLAMRSVNAVNELMEKLGIDDAKWTPTSAEVTGVTPSPTPPPAPVKPTVGQQVGLNLDGQTEAF